jgi:hypothetical protein
VGATGFNTIAYFYVNGVLQGSGTISKSGTSVLSTMILGCGRGGGTIGYNGVWGYMDDLRIFNTALTTNQVQAVYNAQGMPSQQALLGTPLFSQLSTTATSSAVGAFSLRAVNGTTAKAVNVLKYSPIDNSASPITVSSLGTYSTYTNSPFSSSYSDGCIFGSSATLQFPTTGKMQFDAFASNTFIECWIYLPANVTGYPILIQKLGSSSGLYQFYFNGNNSLVIQVRNSTGGTVWYSSAIGSITTGVWTHVSLSFYPSALKLYCSINGAVSGTTYTAFTYDYSTSTPLQIYASSFSGYISNFRVVTNATTLPYITNFTPPTAPLTTYGSGTTLALIQVSYSAQDFYADRRGNLLTAPVTGQKLVDWLGGATGYVATWYDQSGQGNHATQTNTSIQPTIDAINKQISFNGSNYFNLPNGTVPYGNSNYTMTVRHNTLNTSVYNCFIGSGTYGTTNAVNALEYNRDSSIYFNFWWANDNSGGTYAAQNVITAKYINTVGRTLYVNGTSVATNTNLNRASTNIQNTIGSDLRNNQGFGANHATNGQLYYVFIFSTALSDADRQLVESLPIS